MKAAFHRLLLFAFALMSSGANAVDLNKAHVSHLDNGLTLLILEDHDLPVVSVQTAYKTGGRDDPEGRMGLAHFFEHMAFRASKNFPGTRLAGDIYAAGGEWHGYTWIDTITFFATAPKDELDLLLRIEADRLGRLTLDPDSVEAEAGAVIAEMNGYANDPSTILFDATLAAAFQAHPYRKNTIGYEGDVNAITHDDIVDFYEKRIGPDTAVLAIVGDIDANDAKARVKKLFGKFKANGAPQLPPLSEPDLQGEKRVRLEGAVNNKLFRIAYPAPAASHEDYAPFLVLQALAGASSGVSFLQNDWGTPVANNSALAGIVDGLTTWFIPTAQPYIFLVAGTVDADENEGRIETAVQAALDGLANLPVNEERLRAAKTSVLRELVFDIETTEDAAHQLAYFEAIGAFDSLLSLEKSIAAVGADDIQRVAKSYLNADRRTTGWYVPDTDGAPGAIPTVAQLSETSTRDGAADQANEPDHRYAQTNGDIVVAPSRLSPTVSLRAVLSGVYECDLCAPNDPAPGTTSIDLAGLSDELGALAEKMRDAVATAAPATRANADSENPGARVEEIFASRFSDTATNETAAPAFYAIAGNIEPDVAQETIIKVIGAPTGTIAAAALSSSPGDLDIRIPHDKAQTALGYMVDAPAPVSSDALAWRLALYMFAHGYGGRLGEEAISKRGLAYYIDAAYRGGRGAGLVTFNIGVDPDKQAALLETLQAELARFRSEPPNDADLAEAKNHLIGRKISAAQSNSEITAALARDWAGPGLSTIDDYSALVNAITLDDIHAVLPAFTEGDIVVISVGETTGSTAPAAHRAKE